MKGSTANFLVAKIVVDLWSSVLPVHILNPADRNQGYKLAAHTSQHAKRLKDFVKKISLADVKMQS